MFVLARSIVSLLRSQDFRFHGFSLTGATFPARIRTSHAEVLIDTDMTCNHFPNVYSVVN